MKKWILTVQVITLLFLGNITAYMTQAAEVAVTVQPMEGTAISGKFSGFDGEKVLLKSETEQPADGFTIRTLKTMDFQNEAEVRKAEETWKVTAGESVFQAVSVTKLGREFRLKLPNSETEVVAKQGGIQEILFQETKLGKNVDIDADWEEIQTLEMPSDLLVILRDGKLSYYYGTVLEITEKAVRFEQEGQTLNVKFKHVFALRFMTEENEEESENEQLLGMLMDTHGSRLIVSEFALTENAENAKMTTVSGIRVVLPISTLKILDFTAGRVVFLSDLTAETMKWTPYFSAGSSWQKEKLPAIQTFYHPQHDRSFGGKNIRLGGKEYARGMVLASQTRLVFRLPGKFQAFTTVLGIDDTGRPNGNAEVTIFADEKVIFQEMVSGKDEPRVLKLPISGARRLTLLVDYGKEGSFSDFVVFADAQLKK